jgi:hypothetical protein
MPLSAAPTFTPGSTGNIYASNPLAANASTIQGPFFIGVSGQGGSPGSATTGSALSGRVQVINTGGSAVASTNGLQVQVFSTSDGGTTYDTVAFGGTNFVITTIASTSTPLSFDLPPGQYKIKLTNLDASNAITVEVTLGTTA